MQIFRSFWTTSFCLLFLITIFVPMQISAAEETKKEAPEAKETKTKPTVQAQQRLVESVDIQGNRRLRDDDLLYYIQTRPGDVFSAAQLERDLEYLLSLDFFDKTATRVLTEDGVRGGVNVIFEVKELPIIRDLQFEGTNAIQESDILKAFRENRVGISKEAIYNPVKARNATRILRELLSAKGYPNAKVEVAEEEVSATSIALTFNIEQGERSRITKIEFEGNENFKDGELRKQLKLVRKTGLVSRFKSLDIYDVRKLQYDLNKNVLPYMRSKGYFQARIGEPTVEGLGRRRTGFFLPLPLLSSKDDTLLVKIPVTEGKVYRLGEVKIEGNSIYSEQQISAVLGLRKGEIVDGKQLIEALNENLKKLYGSQGFLQYAPEFDPEFKDNPNNPKEGIVDFKITIDEGKQFLLRRLEFSGNTFTRDNVLRREMLINEGDIYNQQFFEFSIIRLNQTGYFEPLDKEKDAEFRTNEELGEVDVLVKVKEKGRQQISFNGGIAGTTGSFFGLEYSTNNLLGRGESLSLQAGLGNRQTNFQLSLTEPYFRDRPISVGFSLFGYSQKFFGEGTFLSQNEAARVGASSNLGFFQTSGDNLFTRSSYGLSLFASAPLDEFQFLRKRRFTRFTRIGLSYQFSISTLKDPAVNQSGNAANFIPVVYRQPNISTSKITPTLVYDSRNYSGDSPDAVTGSRLTLSFAFAGLGGDVRTYQPTIEYMKFIPLRRRKSKNPEVFGFRILAGTTGSFATTSAIRNANSLSFVSGVPIYERYYLGDEYTIRGYNTRSIGPISPVDTYITSRNVIVSDNQFDTTATPTANLPATLRAQIAALGTFTGASGANPAVFNKSFSFIGGDTQLLGNFEYRIPVFGPVSAALYADIGTAFNLRKTDTQVINSEFLKDQPFLGFNDLSVLAARNFPNLRPASAFGGFLLYQNRLLTTSDILPPGTNPASLRTIFLRGEAQTNTLVRTQDSAFGKIGDYRSSVGFELRVQVPVVNVPFRLIYAYNPNARRGFYEELSGLFFSEKKSTFRFSVGRTF